MKIAILGTGNVGLSLASGWRRAGHGICLGSRDPARRELNEFCRQTGVRANTLAAAAASAETVVLAVPWDAVAAVIETCGPMPGKLIIDCTNPIGIDDGRLLLLMGHSESGGEVVASLLPEANVVKTLNQVGAELMSDNESLEARPAMFVAGENADAKSKVMTLVRELGFEPHDAGGIETSRLLEPLGMLWINQSIYQSLGRGWAFGVVRRARGQ